MERQRQTFSIALMARVLQVSRSAFYAWRRPRRTNPRATQRQALDERVKATFRAHMGRYGAPKLTSELSEQGHPYDEKTMIWPGPV
jgi:putative transposase